MSDPKTPEEHAADRQQAKYGPDEREAKLPLWARERLNELRREWRSAEHLAEMYRTEADQVKEEADAIDAGAESDLRYETKHGTRYLPADGTVSFRVGTEEIEVHAVPGGISVSTLNRNGLAIYPVRSTGIGIQLRTQKEEPNV